MLKSGRPFDVFVNTKTKGDRGKNVKTKTKGDRGGVLKQKREGQKKIIAKTL